VKNLGRYGKSHADFYQMEEKLNVAVVGSSHAYCGFDPAVLKEESGLNGYVFGSSNQSMLANYLWAKEAYAHNPYDVLIVEGLSVPLSHGDVENNIRSLNGMVQSPRFYELALTYKRNALNILFPVFLFHDEWQYFADGLFSSVDEEIKKAGTNGFDGLESVAGEKYQQLLVQAGDESRDYLKFTYLDKIREFCEEKGIQLYVVKTIMASADTNRWDAGIHNTLADYCESYQIPFYDFNTEQYAREAGLSVSADVAQDLRHANKDGAAKMTKYLAGVIAEDLEG
jgi:hypothetical protein